MLGHYHVEGELGSGGMGVVYQATDTRLNRSVAIKMLHESFVRDAERLARFEREARVLASLNHGNIAAIHGLDEVDGTRFLVMEYVPGKTLADLLDAKSLNLKEALEICRQIAEALEAAHEKGIIHRDLKPANIKITPEGKVKVLDFGLAKPLETAAAAGTEAITVTAADATGVGMVMGTVPYMSPEQACGKPLDRRTDVWAFGCVLYEAVTGKRAFRGNSTTEILAGILEREPDWSMVPEALPASVGCLLRRCLHKDLHSRLHDIADARLEIEEALSGAATGALPTVPVKTLRTRALAAALAGVLAAAALAGWLGYRFAAAKAPPARVARFTVDVPDGRSIIPSFNPQVVFSRDAKSLLFAAVSTATGNVVYRRQLDDLQTAVLIKGPATPVFSPDDRWLILLDTAGGRVVKYALGGGAPVPLITEMRSYSSGDWGADGYYYWTNALAEGIVRTPVAGGPAEQVVAVNEQREERQLKYARLLPGGKALIFTVGYAGIESFDDARIEAFDLRSKKRVTLVQGGTFGRYSPSGHLVYARGGSLYAVPFDPGRLEVTGTPQKMLDGVLMSTNTGVAYFDVSSAGDLAYAVGVAEGGERTLQWVDRSGKATPLPLPARSYLHPRISPDGRQLAIEVEGVNHDFYVYDFERGVMTKITNDGLSHGPVWSPDSKYLAFRSWKAEMMTMWRIPSDRSGPPERLTKVGKRQSVDSFSPDGRYLLFNSSDDRANRTDVWVLPMQGERTPKPFISSRAVEGSAKFSPDGKWVAYCSTESGRAEVFIQPWPGPGPKIQISSEGGTDPIWRRDGRQLFYRNGERMMAVTMDLGPPVRAGRPAQLWEGPYSHGMSSSCGPPGPTSANYDVTPDGRRFLMIKDNHRDVKATRVVVILNWARELKAAFQPGAPSAGRAAL
ncbi:MAG: serine/threonine-protein kinase [Acidobacteria bacterium]|nr:serine/threonine-protein kinase [Acidobacteriota bacterium]